MNNSKDSLGDRMKSQYEQRTRTALPRRTYSMIRLDGKAFHSYTRGCERPFDKALMDDMDLTAKFLVENIQGAKIAYVQSDEISILLTDFEDIATEAWFDGNIQKMVSISAAQAAAKFNQLRAIRRNNQYSFDVKTIPNCTPCIEDIMKSWREEGKSWEEIDKLRKSKPFCNMPRHFSDLRAYEYIYGALTDANLIKREIENAPLAFFDSRVFTIPDPTEVENYFIWRQQDATRNSIQMAAQSMFSHKALQNVNCDKLQEMMWTEKGVNWNDYPEGFKRGRCIVKETFCVPLVTSREQKEIEEGDFALQAEIVGKCLGNPNLERSKWVVQAPPIFTQDREYLRKRIPRL